MSIDLPKSAATFFWDCDFASLSWEKHRDFIIRRLLQSGSWEILTWLRAEVGDAALRQWIVHQHGAGLSPRQLRFWEAVLDLPGSEVTQWVRSASMRPWERRLHG
jgi:hypothetical protein